MTNIYILILDYRISTYLIEDKDKDSNGTNMYIFILIPILN